MSKSVKKNQQISSNDILHNFTMNKAQFSNAMDRMVQNQQKSAKPINLNPIKKTYVIDGPREGKVAQRLRMHSQVMQKPPVPDPDMATPTR
mmetsp:Transcript_12380/g.19273  ORF Transcript_12380/g.19273 Transcript_12380/m.19273 type:complete len:91 (+) Transcript_12380:2259-2531(+)